MLDLGLQPLALLLGSSALADVVDGAHHARRLAAGIALTHSATSINPDPLAILGAGAIIDLVEGGAVFEVLLHGRQHMRLVLRVNALLPEFVPRLRLAGRQAMDRIPAVIQDHAASGDVPIPQAMLRIVQDQAQTFLAHAQRGFGTLAISDVPEDGLDADRAGKAVSNGDLEHLHMTDL